MHVSMHEEGILALEAHQPGSSAMRLTFPRRRETHQWRRGFTAALALLAIGIVLLSVTAGAL